MTALLLARRAMLCPRCSTPLDEGPVVWRCAPCGREMHAADVPAEYAPAAMAKGHTCRPCHVCRACRICDPHTHAFPPARRAA